MVRGHGKLLAVCISERKGERKHTVARADCVPDHGIAHDAHAGPGLRQVSLLSEDDIGTMRSSTFEPQPGDFGENLIVSGGVLEGVQVGDRLEIDHGPSLEVTMIGKTCHDEGCAIRRAVGTCIMPTRGVFTRVVTGGELHPGQTVQRVFTHRNASTAPEEQQ
jgi:MOSC domain-containing protein YiiM